MATGTVVDDTDVIEVSRPPGNGCVTVIAGIATGDMRWVLARRYDAIVAGIAGSDDLGVVDCENGCENIGVMTVLANICCLNMGGILAGRIDPIMAADTVAGNADMIEIGRQPGHCGVAIIAGIASCDMTRIFPGRNKAVMTGTASANDLRVIDRVGRHPNVGVVTVLTNVTGLYMGRILASRIRTVMAVDAVIRDADVVEIRG